jgi:hypothetical protein
LYWMSEINNAPRNTVKNACSTKASKMESD